jgi:hypothetical protein
VGNDEENQENVENVMAAYLVRGRNRTGGLRKVVPAHCYSPSLRFIKAWAVLGLLQQHKMKIAH